MTDTKLPTILAIGVQIRWMSQLLEYLQRSGKYTVVRCLNPEQAKQRLDRPFTFLVAPLIMEDLVNVILTPHGIVHNILLLGDDATIVSQTVMGTVNVFVRGAPSLTRQIVGIVDECVKALKPRRNILLVDDEDQMLDIVSEVLVAGNYHVTRFNNPGLVLKAPAPDIEGHDLLLTDWMMPGLNDMELMRELKMAGLLPPKILIMTGNVSEQLQKDMFAIQQEFPEYDIRLIGKPFQLTTLVATVGEILGNPTTNGS